MTTEGEEKQTGGAVAIMSQRLGDQWGELEEELRLLYCTTTKVNLPDGGEMWWKRGSRNKQDGVWGVVYVPPAKPGGGATEAAIALPSASIAVRTLCADHIEALISALDAHAEAMIAQLSAAQGRVSETIERVRARRVVLDMKGK